MPVPPSTMLSIPARQTFERLRSSSRPGVRPGVVHPHSPTRPVPQFDYLAYIDQICAGICSAWSIWRSAAALVGVTINGPHAMGGRVVGPPLAGLIQANGPLQTPEALKMTQSIATGIGNGWAQLTGTISVPGLLWYPTFAVIPARVAPPTPNLPTAVGALTMAAALVGRTQLKIAMIGADPNGSADHHCLYEAIAEAFEQGFQFWKTTSMVTNVLGTGPVPTFAPPQVPTGAVVGGTGNMTPGGFV